MELERRPLIFGLGTWVDGGAILENVEPRKGRGKVAWDACLPGVVRHIGPFWLLLSIQCPVYALTWQCAEVESGCLDAGLKSMKGDLK